MTSSWTLTLETHYQSLKSGEELPKSVFDLEVRIFKKNFLKMLTAYLVWCIHSKPFQVKFYMEIFFMEDNVTRGAV